MIGKTSSTGINNAAVVDSIIIMYVGVALELKLVVEANIIRLR